MNEATVRLIDGLAQKLGTTAEHIWGVLIKQAPIEGACGIVMIVVFLALLVVGFIFLKIKTNSEDCLDRDFAMLGWVVWGIALIVVMIGITVAIPDLIAAFYNPEYWALQKVLTVMRK